MALSTQQEMEKNNNKKKEITRVTIYVQFKGIHNPIKKNVEILMT